MAPDLIRYDLLVQEALRGVVKNVLAGIADQNLPGEHHCYITFVTTAPGVRISAALQQRFPHNMTIVLQHQFSDLIVSEHLFEVKLSFGGVPERVVVPFAAIVRFEDPSVGFLLSFEQVDARGQLDEPEKQPPQAKALKAGERQPRGATTEPQAPKREIPKEAIEAVKDDAPEEGLPTSKPSDPKIISIDAFRKKP
jgi:uncharacterized protein